MKKLTGSLGLLIACSMYAFAQTPEEIKTTFPGVEIAYQHYDQELTLFLKDEIPVAERKTNIDMLMLTDKNVNMLSRYKVFHSGYNELTQLEAYTKVPAGNKYKTVKVSDKKTTNSTDNDIFYDDMKETSFDFPGLTQNAIAHVNYTQFNKDAHLITGFHLPNYIPVVNASFTLVVPNDIKINYLVKNDSKNIFQYSVEQKRKETIYKWTVKNIKQDELYSNAPDTRYFQPHIIVYITSYENKEGQQPFLNSLPELHKWNNSFIRNLNLSPDPVLKNIVDSLVKGLSSQKEKAKKIYKWVQQHIKYVAFENGLEGFRPRQAAEICEKRYGDCKDMSSIITQMLRLAGIPAYYTWIGSRDLPYKYSETPLPIVDNHMISTALIEDKWIFLDGTDHYASFDLPPAFIQGKEALISINENEYKLLTVPVATPANNLILDSTYIRLEDGGISGYESVHYTGYFGKEIYSALVYKDEKETKEYINSKMGKGSNKFLLGNFNITKTQPEENRAHIRADFTIPGYSKKIGREYFINLNLEKILENQVIDIDKRKVPIENEYNYSISQYHILEIPKGFKVTYIPKDFNFENDLVKVSLTYKLHNEKLIASQEVQNKKLLISPADFEEWNKPMKAIQPFYKESVVLEMK